MFLFLPLCGIICLSLSVLVPPSKDFVRHLFREAFNIWFIGVNQEFYQRPWTFVNYEKDALQVEYIIIIKVHWKSLAS